MKIKKENYGSANWSEPCNILVQNLSSLFTGSLQNTNMFEPKYMACFKNVLTYKPRTGKLFLYKLYVNLKKTVNTAIYTPQLKIFYLDKDNHYEPQNTTDILQIDINCHISIV